MYLNVLRMILTNKEHKDAQSYRGAWHAPDGVGHGESPKERGSN